MAEPAAADKITVHAKPQIDKKPTKSFFKASDMRHPIIERLLMQNGNEIYVPNDCSCEDTHCMNDSHRDDIDI